MLPGLPAWLRHPRVAGCMAASPTAHSLWPFEDYCVAWKLSIMKAQLGPRLAPMPYAHAYIRNPSKISTYAPKNCTVLKKIILLIHTKYI